MGTLIVGDVHGCAAELAALVALVQPARVVLVGDLFTKGPDPAGVWALVQAHDMAAVLGNHDARLLQALRGERPRDAHAHQVIARLDQTPGDWRTWLEACPLFLEVDGWTVVHAALHPTGSLEQTSRGMALSLRRWPAKDPDAPRWVHAYRGERRVVFGHDAVAGLQRVERDGQPWLIGLDSGCVYGKHLSGYVLQTDTLVQVPAAEIYCPIT